MCTGVVWEGDWFGVAIVFSPPCAIWCWAQGCASLQREALEEGADDWAEARVPWEGLAVSA